MASVRPVEYIKKKTGPYSQANKTNKITFLRFIFRKHFSNRGTSADLEKKLQGAYGRKGRDLLWGFNPTVTKNKTMPTHGLEKKRPHPLSRSGSN